MKGRKGWLLVYLICFGLGWLSTGVMLTVLEGGWLAFGAIEWIVMTIVFATMYNDRDTAIGANQAWLGYVIISDLILLQEAGVVPAIGAGVWLWYWSVSKRVKATYYMEKEDVQR